MKTAVEERELKNHRVDDAIYPFFIFIFILYKMTGDREKEKSWIVVGHAYKTTSGPIRTAFNEEKTGLAENGGA